MGKSPGARALYDALRTQHTSLPGEKLTAQLVRTPANDVMAPNRQVAELDKAIEARFRDNHTFDVITSLPGRGIILGGEFLSATGGDLSAFGSVAPVPRDSGRSSATCDAHSDTTAVSNVSSAPRRCSPFGTARNPTGSTTANAPRAGATPLLYSHSPAASASSGPYCAADGATSSHRPPLSRLDRPH
jgi:hypothetical protein